MTHTLATACLVRRNRHRWRKTASGRQHYNYFRDYEPGTGRYVQSDPIGLTGGVSTFAYGMSSPLLNRDPLGLEVELSLFDNIVPTPFNTNAAAFVSPPGVYTIAGHGDEFKMKGPSGEILRPSDVYRMMLADKDFEGKSAILLLSCETGRGTDNFAKRLANLANMPVVAADNYVFFRPNARGFFPGSRDSETGKYIPGTSGNWVVFRPSRPFWERW